MFLFQTVGYVSFRHAKLTACREGRVRILEIECCLRLFCFVFFRFYRFGIFTIKCTRTQTRKVRRDAKDRKETASSSLHSLSGLRINVLLGAFIYKLVSNMI